MELLERAPGLHVAELARRLGLTWNGTLHHLRDLEAAGIVTSAWEGRRRVCFTGSASPEAVRRLRALTSPSAVRIAREVLRSPNVTIGELAARAELSRRVVYHHVQKFREVGLVRAAGEPLRIEAATDLPRALGDR